MDILDLLELMSAEWTTRPWQNISKIEELYELEINEKPQIFWHILFLFRLLNLAFLHSSNEQLSWSMMFLTKNLIEELPNRLSHFTGRYKARA